MGGSSRKKIEFGEVKRVSSGTEEAWNDMVDGTQEDVKRNACKRKNTRKISATSCRRGLGRASGLELDLVPPPIPLPRSCASPPLSRTPGSGTVCLANCGAELFVDSSRRSECCCSLCRCSVWFLNIWRHCNRISISSCVAMVWQ